MEKKTNGTVVPFEKRKKVPKQVRWWVFSDYTCSSGSKEVKQFLYLLPFQLDKKKPS